MKMIDHQQNDYNSNEIMLGKLINENECLGLLKQLTLVVNNADVIKQCFEKNDEGIADKQNV